MRRGRSSLRDIPLTDRAGHYAGMTRSADPSALAGLRVLDLSDSTGGAYCAKLLADLGADVTKIEPPAGGRLRRLGPFIGDAARPERSIPFLAVNTNKRVRMLDVESAPGRETLRELVASA